MSDPVDTILDLLQEAGAERYGDNVDQLQHALQCADNAVQAGAAPALVAAALLHDIGHLVDKHAEGAAERGIDRHHEDIGAGWLGRWFGAAVTEPIRLHVPAKRYLCAVEGTYWQDLSAASKRTLTVQGGAFDDAAADAFIAQPFAADAVQVRRWDDLAKVPGRAVPALEHYRPLLQSLVEAAA
jgi:gamma-butyrobetaine dioxygenase